MTDSTRHWAPPGGSSLPDLTSTDVVDLTQAICDWRSVSGDEGPLADAVQAALAVCEHLEVLREGNTVVARTHLGRMSRVVVAGHLDTVPVQGNLPTQRRVTQDGTEVLWGRGTVDMKGGVAVALHLAATLAEPTRDVTWVFYDNEEVDAERNGLNRVVRDHPDWLAADLAVLGEPTDAGIEGGCNGTLRVAVTTRGKTAHSARSWMGQNAIHDAVEILRRLAEYNPRVVQVDGLTYREGMNAVEVSGGIAGNMIPDECTVVVNYRFAPSSSTEDALCHVRRLFAGFEVEVLDVAPGARPGLDHPMAQDFVEAVAAATGRDAVAKQGWTDVARFSALGIPAVNFGPGDPLLAHADDEQVPNEQIRSCAAALLAWLSEAPRTEPASGSRHRGPEEIDARHSAGLAGPDDSGKD